MIKLIKEDSFNDKHLLLNMMLCNNAYKENDEYKGSPIEVALLYMLKNKTDDMNLPITIDELLMGAVSKSWSVFCFFSSEKERIVRIGITKKTTVIVPTKTYVISATPVAKTE